MVDQLDRSLAEIITTTDIGIIEVDLASGEVPANQRARRIFFVLIQTCVNDSRTKPGEVIGQPRRGEYRHVQDTASRSERQQRADINDHQGSVARRPCT